MAVLTMEDSERHAYTRAIIRDAISPANPAGWDLGDASRDAARVVSDVSVLCPPSGAYIGNNGREPTLRGPASGRCAAAKASSARAMPRVLLSRRNRNSMLRA